MVALFGENDDAPRRRGVSEPLRTARDGGRESPGHFRLARLGFSTDHRSGPRREESYPEELPRAGLRVLLDVVERPPSQGRCSPGHIFPVERGRCFERVRRESPPAKEVVPALSTPGLAPGESTPPGFRASAPTVPRPFNTPPSFTAVALPEIFPETSSVPSSITVGPV